MPHNDAEAPLLDTMASYNSCNTDSLFESVNTSGSGAISLAEFLVWVTSTHNPGAPVLEQWIAHFNR